MAKWASLTTEEKLNRLRTFVLIEFGLIYVLLVVLGFHLGGVKLWI